MPDVYKEVVDWSGGVLSAGQPDQLPDNAFPEGYNTAFVKIDSEQRCSIGSRPGLTTINDTAFSGSPAVHFQHLYSYYNAGAWTRYLATVANDGTLRYKNEDNTYTSTLDVPANFPSPSTLCFTAGDDPVDAAVMNNRLYLVNAAGESRSLVGQTYVPWGLSPIASFALVDDASGSSGMPEEAFDIGVTSYNSTSGGESSLSATQSVTLAGANSRIEVTITPTAAESARYTHWRVFLRRPSTQAVLYQVLSLENVGGTTTVTDGNIPIATTTIYVDLSAAQIAALTTVAPSTTENDGLPSNVTNVVTYGNRLLVTDGINVYWSKANRGDNFRPEDFEPIHTGEGDQIKGFHVFSDEFLMVFLSTAVWGLFGNDPQTWEFRPIDVTIGLAGHNSIAGCAGHVSWWADAVGPVYYEGEGTSIVRAGQDLLGAAAVTTDLELSRQDYISAGVDPAGHRVVWAVTPAGGARNTQLIPFNYLLHKFEASYWDPIDAASLHTGFSDDGSQKLFLGGYSGQVFEFDAAVRKDGIPGGTYTGTFTPGSTSITTITGTGFYNTNSKLVERKVVVIDSEYAIVAKRRITSNDATTLTLDSAITGLSLSETYTYFIGGPDFRLFTRWEDHGQPFLRKRFDRLYFHMGATSGVQNSFVTTQIEFTDINNTAQTAFTVTGALWDTAVWDSSSWVLPSALKRRLSISRNGTAVRAAFYAFMPNRDVVVYKVGFLSRLLSDRYFG